MTTDDVYFAWLCKKVKISPSEAPYFRLALALHNSVFVVDRNSLDMNRAYDGMNLRTEFIHMHGLKGSAANRGSCSMLELMIGLSKRMAFLMESVGKPKRIAEFFWKMVENLGLSGLDDSRFELLKGQSAVEKAVGHVNKRDYLPDGTGGLFPVHGARVDLRKMEIWYQMHLWLSENYRSEIL